MTNEGDKIKKYKLANKNKSANNYNKQSPFTIGLAMTHEQVSDTLTEGTIDGEIDEVNESTTN